ncbi:MAG TPA: VWA domain-containing protein [Pyrinomonadaceae bacterium]|jgi:VWFA-related protein
MQPTKSFVARALLFAALLLAGARVAPVRAQEAQQQDDEVLRIKAELVQTDMMVFDRQGRFVEGLTPEQFELTLDGKPRPVSFFERVAAGSATEAAQLSAKTNGVAGLSAGQGKAPPPAAAPGRVIFFFLDDLHLSESSLMRARRALTEFVETQMGQDDRVAIVSASGQIGFLQQLTEYKPVLRTAIGRLNYKRNPETYAGKVPISDYQAMQVTDHYNRDLFIYLVAATINEYQASGPLMRVAANMVRNRVRQISAKAKTVTNELLDVLESLMQSSSQLPGRKLVFFISDGFMADVRGSNSVPLLKRVTEMAARTNVVVYTMDARGTFGDPSVDASRNEFPDGMSTGTQARNPMMEASALQAPLHTLAEDTGGRAIINSNSFPDAFRQAIDETASYYLLAWRPDTEEQRTGRARIKVSIKDRPDLRVRLRRNYYAPPPAGKTDEKSADTKKAEALTPEAELLTSLGAIYPRRTLPVALAVGYLNTPDQGLALKVSMHLERGALDVVMNDAKKSEVDVIGAAIDDRGVIVTFKQVLTVAADPSAQNERQPVVWNQQLKLPPGLYQVRVAVRERTSGRTGSAQQWIEVPDVSAGHFQLSSLFLGERKAARPDEKFANASGPRPVTVDVDRRFPRSSVLRFQTYVYNASRDGATPDVEIQARVLGDGRAVMTVAPARVPADTTKDLTRLPYWSEIALDKLAPGKYVLQVTARDRKTKSASSQQSSFVVE